MNAVLGELLLSELQSMDQIVENAEPEDEKDMARALSHPHDQWPKPVESDSQWSWNHDMNHIAVQLPRKLCHTISF